MKKYPNLYEIEDRRKMRLQLDELLFFQEMLLTDNDLNEQFCGRAQEIAAGLQPWIEALICRLNC